MTSKFPAIFNILRWGMRMGFKSSTQKDLRQQKRNRRGRSCRIEELEHREMLSVNLLNFALPQNPENDQNFDDSDVLEVRSANCEGIDTLASPGIIAFAAGIGAPPENADEGDLEIVERAKELNNLRDIHTEWDYDSGRLVGIYSSTLSGYLDLTGLTALKRLECANGSLTGLKLTGCGTLEYLDCANNNLQWLDDASSCTALRYLDCANNNLDALNVSGCTSLNYLDCSANKLNFSTIRLPNRTIENCDCGRQTNSNISLPATVDFEAQLNLSAQNFARTKYEWRYRAGGGGIVNPSLYTETNGVFTFNGFPEGSTTIYCVITNEQFPNLELRTDDVTIQHTVVTLDAPGFVIVARNLANPTTLPVSWEGVSNASGYRVEWYTDANFTTYVGQAVVTGTTFTIPDLDTGTAYYIRVQALGNDGWTFRNSTWVSAQPQPAITPLAPPDNLSATKTATNPTKSLTVSWNAADSKATQYEVEYREAGSLSSWIPATGSPISGTSISFLVPLANQNYEIQVRAANTNNESDWRPTLAQTDPLPLTKPSINSATATGSNSIRVVWNAVPNAVGYQIEYANNLDFIGAPPLIDLTAAQFAALTDGYTIPGLSDFTEYWVRVRATGSGEYETFSVWSDSQDETTLAQPTNLVAASTTTPATSFMTLTWEDGKNKPGIRYEVQYKQSGTDDWTQVPGPDSSISERTIIIPNLIPNEYYDFRVCAVNTDGSSYWTPIITEKANGIALATPRITSVDTTGSDSIRVTWDGGITSGIGVPNADAYEIEWSTIPFDDINYVPQAPQVTVSPAEFDTLSNGYPIAGLDPFKTYFVRIRATGSGMYNDYSAWSNVLSSMTEKSQLSVPTGLKVESDPSVPSTSTTKGIIVSWDRVVNASGYTIEYITAAEYAANGFDNADFESVWDGSQTSVDISGLDVNTTYYVRIMAIGVGAYVDSDFLAPAVSIVTNLTQLHPPILNPVFATSDTSISVSWNPDPNATAYVVEYSTDPNFVTDVMPAQVVPPSITSIPITGLDPLTTYYVRVKAIGDPTSAANRVYDDSEWSNVVDDITVKTPLAAPTGVMTTVKDATTVTVTWRAVPNASSGYIVQYATNEGFTENVGTQNVQPGETTTVITNLTTGTRYYIRVCAIGDEVYAESPYSQPPAIVTPKGPPAPNPVAPKIKKSTTITTVTLAWAANDLNATYDVYVRYTKKCTPQEVVLAPGQLEYTYAGTSITGAIIKDLNPRTGYTITVVARNADGRMAKPVFVATKTKTYSAVKRFSAVKAQQTITSVTLAWRASTALETTGYKVEVYHAGKLIQTVPVVGRDTTNMTVTGLSPATKYTFAIQAVAGDSGKESLAARAHGSTAKYPAVTKVNVVNITAREVSLTWTDPKKSDKTLYYEIVQWDGRAEKPVKVTFTSDTSAKIEGLLPATTHTFIVRAVAQDVNGKLIKSLDAKVTVTLPRLV